MTSSDYERRALAMMDLAAVEAELPAAKGKRRKLLLAQKAVIGRKLWPGVAER